MSANHTHEFPVWDDFYKGRQVETMPWFNPELDEDLAHALAKEGLETGSALDLGTGPGTQAFHLARLGFEVTATDISATALRLAEEKFSRQGVKINWQVDDILSTRLDGQFDVVFDRGCFHVLDPDQRPDYVATVARLLKVGGHLFVKCFSRLQPGDQGPYRFTPEQVREIFADQLKVASVKETEYQGTLKPNPRALFCVMQRVG